MAVFHPKRELWEAVVAAAAQLEDEWRLDNLVAALGTRRACVEPGPVALGGLRVRSQAAGSWEETWPYRAWLCLFSKCHPKRKTTNTCLAR